MELVILFSFYGIISSGIYLLFCFIRRLFNYNMFVQIPLDLICGFIIGLLFCYCTITFAVGIIRFYLIFAFCLGFVISLITFKNFVATLSDFVYNIIIKATNKIRRKANEHRKTNKNC